MFLFFVLFGVERVVCFLSFWLVGFFLFLSFFIFYIAFDFLFVLQCSLTCGKGVQTRTITCVKDATSNEPVSDSLCDASAKPNEQQSCVLAVCNPEISKKLFLH